MQNTLTDLTEMEFFLPAPHFQKVCTKTHSIVNQPIVMSQRAPMNLLPSEFGSNL